ncbi:hypothetical protein [Paraburkholderia lycopersici]|uniref:Uncharacterized protein n=1 Tax=Paraburkholderia lycopersici TaxID=416944 RepID=A0A1G6L7S5_9BURK|nr:hypothetical protein [Paraburkholderia lycopersici]SDC39183.1 hypothetical protein SAMN05421548_106138 [Paraburkholderia lycopersici]
MNRRAFLGEATAAALGAVWRAQPLGLALAGSVPDAGAGLGAASAAVFDPALPQGRALAREAARAGCAAWAVGDGASDIGGLWHARIARRLEPGATVIGALRPSDRFVLARLAAARRVALRDFASAAHRAPAKSDSRDCAHRT